MIRIATIGTSSITCTFIDAASQVPEVAVTTAYSRDAERAADFAEEFDLAAQSDLDALLGSAEIDAVYVASPNGVHGEQALAAIEAGKHVIVEKPAVPTAAEFSRLVDAAAKTGVVLLEAMRNVYDPGLAEIGRLAAELGVLRRASFAYCQRSGRYDKVLAGERVNIFDPALAGGALYDLGVYPVAAMVQLFGEPREAIGASIPIPGGADGAGVIVAIYDGFVVDLSYSKITASNRVSEIQGELGTLTFDHVTQPVTAQVRMLDGTVSEYSFAGPANNMVHEIRRFADLIEHDGDASGDHERTLATLRTVERVKRAELRAEERG